MHIRKLRVLFSQLGLPELIVSDNGPLFVSDEFRLFVAQNGINHKGLYETLSVGTTFDTLPCFDT